jgi:hypothetical protein
MLRDLGANDVERVLMPKFGDFRTPEFRRPQAVR